MRGLEVVSAGVLNSRFRWRRWLMGWCLVWQDLEQLIQSVGTIDVERQKLAELKMEIQRVNNELTGRNIELNAAESRIEVSPYTTTRIWKMLIENPMRL